MKTKEEIEQLAEKEMMGMEGRFGFVAGYEKCQEDYKDKRYIDEHMLLAYVNGGANLAEDFKDATKMKENFNRLMAAIDKSIDGNTNN
jgi:hypothetical protein